MPQVEGKVKTRGLERPVHRTNVGMADRHPGRHRATNQHKSAILITASLVSSLIMLDSNIVAISLPAVARSLNATFTDIEWVISAYILTFAALLLAAGSFADRYGRKRATLIGLVIFTIASAFCGLATSAVMLNLSRAVQGVGASLLLTAALAVINHAYTGAERAKAYAFWGACLGIAITTGPIIGGVITNFLSWRWAFLVNLPVCTVLIVMALRFIRESRDHEAKRLDFAGILTFSFGLFFLIWAVIDGNSVGWTTTVILGRLAAAASLLVVFGVVEARQDRPMVDLGLFKRATFVGSTFAMLGYAGAAQVMIFYLPLYLQNAYGFAPAWAGVAMLPFALPMFLTPRLGARLASRHSGRTLLTAGLLVTLVGNLLLAACAASALSYAAFLVGMLVAGTGAGLLNSETAKVMQGAVPAQRAGMASGLSATARFTGLLVGVAGIGSVLSANAVSSFTPAAARLGITQDLADSVARRIISGDLIGAVSQVPAQIQHDLQQLGMSAFAQGFSFASLTAAGVALISAILTFALVKPAETAAHASAEAAPAME
jgi:EmrB/QacA subfamily drug resistance transporter